MKMSSLLDIGYLFFLILVICCIAANGYIRYFLILITAIYYLTGSGMLGYVLAKPLLVENTDIKLCKNTSGIILLGSGLNDAFGNIEPGIGAYERIVKTAQIYHMYPQKIIISGGQTSTLDISEAQVYAEQLYKLGIPKSAMLLEDKSKNTYQNAKFTKELINNDSGTYCLVTGGIHYTMIIPSNLGHSCVKKRRQIWVTKDIQKNLKTVPLNYVYNQMQIDEK